MVHLPETKLQRANPLFKCSPAPRAPEGEGGKARFATLLVLLALLVPLFLPALASAQRISSQELKFYTQPYTPPARAQVSRNVFLVEVGVVVRNAKGRAVAGLERKDFKVYDNGKERAITQFKSERLAPDIFRRQSVPASPSVGHAPSKATASEPAPRYVALFFDDRKTPFEFLRYAQLAAKKFVREDLHPGDRVGVFTASRSVTLDFTADRQKLLQAIDSLRVEKLGTPAPLYSFCTHYRLGPYTAYLILDRADSQVLNLYTCPNAPRYVRKPTRAEIQGRAQNILSAEENISKFTLGSLDSVIGELARMHGRRVVVLISSGFFTASLKRAVDAVTGAALGAGVVVDALDAKGLAGPEAGKNENTSPYVTANTPFERMLRKEKLAADDDVMAILATDTGGTFFRNDNDLAAGLQEMAAVPEVSYLLAFSPRHVKDDGRFHRLKVKVTAPGASKVQSRRGYFAPARAKRKRADGAAKLNEAVLGTNEINGIPVQVTARPGRLRSGKTGMQILLRVDPRSLAFQKRRGRHLGRLRLVIALFSGKGTFVAGESGLVDMALRDKTLEDLSRRGLNATLVLQAHEGKYRLRAVVEDLRNGKMFATTRSASIP